MNKPKSRVESTGLKNKIYLSQERLIFEGQAASTVTARMSLCQRKAGQMQTYLYAGDAAKSTSSAISSFDKVK
jgi:hypothetical protein